ncbi:PIN domain-containing protein [Rhizobium halophytocola]|uniref:Ribonuclease VapC n=1 Tax=Rhizobium halophytocola TaxID=735519 RepID=A0ABS4E397_9HYPH|nr:PIN domain-containing protein [Rhizobium halophytocola]MBP1852396.1 putative nucleic acid-binding protein [Rhizobium halophytocola]
MFLLDTNILSLLNRPERHETNAKAIVTWLLAQTDRTFLSVVSSAEIQYGIERARRLGSANKADSLTEWFSELAERYADRFIALDQPAAIETGRLLALAEGRGWQPGFEDAAIAASARLNDLTVVTRNLRHFAIFDVAAIDPYQQLPS